MRVDPMQRDQALDTSGLRCPCLPYVGITSASILVANGLGASARRLKTSEILKSPHHEQSLLRG